MITKKTKIVATIGPASDKPNVLEAMIKSGLNVMRLNFSHGDYAEHQARIDLGRKLSKKLKQPIALLQDLPGPKIRLGDFYQPVVELKAGNEFVLSTKPRVGDECGAFINYKKLPQEISVGSTIFVDDGKKELRVEKIVKENIHCRIIVGGPTKGRRGLNIPGAYLSISSLTPTDKKHVLFGIENKVDFMALSFVRRAKDVLDLRRILKEHQADIAIIAKIETMEALDNLAEIIEVADGIMVARGDLAVEVPKERVPVWQKIIIQKCNELGKPVITATQMLESMINNPVPTRAEVNDVANAIFDGTDAVMLSEETTLGIDPVQAVKTMTDIAIYTEQYIDHSVSLREAHLLGKAVTDAVSLAAITLASEVEAKKIIALSQTGFTARMLARYKPANPILVLTASEQTYRRLALSFGCRPYLLVNKVILFSKLISTVRGIVLKRGLLKNGDKVVLVAGLPFNQSGSTNTISVQTI